MPRWLDSGPRVSVTLELGWNGTESAPLSSHNGSGFSSGPRTSSHSTSIGIDVTVHLLLLILAGYIWWKGCYRWALALFQQQWNLFGRGIAPDEKPLSARQYAECRNRYDGQAYVYRKLDSPKAEIRLVHIFRGSESDPVCVSITHASLHNRPKFKALSYAWGDPRATNSIIINGRKIQVASNLAVALDNLRKDHSADYLVPYWIDALCINQTDPDEKSEQVRLMTRIYEQASIVIIWLGEPTAQTEVAFAAMKAISAQYHELAHATRPNSLSQATPQFSRECKVIREMCYNPYFSRVWIAQEVTNPRTRKVEIIAGRHMQRISIYDSFITCWHALNLSTIERKGTLSSESRELLQSTLSAINEIRRVMYVRSVRYRLSNELISRFRLPLLRSGRPVSIRATRKFWQRNTYRLLEVFRHLQCEDPRDKVYAVYTILSPYIPKSYINYRFNLQETYVHVVQHAIQDTGNLDILAYCGLRSHDLPSWVPDWRCPQDDGPFCLKSDNDGACPYACSKNTGPQVNISAHVMRAQGIIIGSVDWCSQHTGPFDDSCQSIWNSIAKESEIGSVKAAEIYNRTIRADCICHFRWDPFGQAWSTQLMGYLYGFVDILCLRTMPQPKGPLALLEEFIEHNMALDRLRIAYRRIGPYLDLQQHILDTESDAQNTMNWDAVAIREATNSRLLGIVATQRVAHSCSHRLPCRTELHRKSLGLLPRGAREGDKIAILMGGKAPMVLRQCVSGNSSVESSYEIVGESYIHGFMDGEALELVECGLLKEDSFIIV